MESIQLTPLVTIIIPTYNCASSLGKSLDSVLSQSYHNYQLFIVDGGSTDNTLAIIKEYHTKNSRLKYLSEPDNGIYDAMNKGISLSKGEWIYFLGSDDALYNENVLSDIFNNAANLNFDILYGNVYSPRFHGVYDGEFTPDKLYSKNICHQAIFFRKSIFIKTGLFDLRYRAHADWDHNLKWFLNDTIRTKYLDMIIADYADGGFSSQAGDPLFHEAKDEKFLKLGKDLINHDLKKNLYLIVAIKKKNKKQYFSFWYYKLNYWKLSHLPFLNWS